MFEHGAAQGDRPGEFQFWVEDYPLKQTFEFPFGPFALQWNPDDGVLGICIGGGIANATASVMALGLDQRFDLSKAYWLIAGIAGGDPADASLGSAVWARHVVDGDLLYEIDAREIPTEWPYGMIPLGGDAPADTPQDISTGWTLDTIHFALNAELAQWARQLTADVPLADTPEMAAFRAQFTEHAEARRPPEVLLGDTLSASTYWHGERFNRWANDWVRLYAGPEANFVTSNMEDSGTLTALTRLAAQSRVDLSRVMVLRTVSNYTQPPAGRTAAWSATADYPNEGRPALRAAFEVGSAVVRHVVAHWPELSDATPKPVTDE